MEDTIIEKTLTKGGQRAVIKIGNVVIDILRGYREGIAILDIYPYTEEEEAHYLVRDEKNNILATR